MISCKGGKFHIPAPTWALFIIDLCSDLVPTISVVGSAGGIFTTAAAPAAGRGGIGGGGGREVIGAAGTDKSKIIVMQREEIIDWLVDRLFIVLFQF